MEHPGLVRLGLHLADWLLLLAITDHAIGLPGIEQNLQISLCSAACLPFSHNATFIIHLDKCTALSLAVQAITHYLMQVGLP